MAEPFIGEIRPFAFGFAPKGWARCEGQLLAISSNVALFSILGVMYGGDGKTNFALPDLRARTPLGVDINTIPQGTMQGEQAHTLTLNEIPQHTHQVLATNTPATMSSVSNSYWASSMSYAPLANGAMGANAIATAGASQAHTNMQPFTAVSFCIALQGMFPPHS